MENCFLEDGFKNIYRLKILSQRTLNLLDCVNQLLHHLYVSGGLVFGFQKVNWWRHHSNLTF